MTLLPLALAYTGQVQTPRHAWGYTAAASANVGGSGDDAFEAARPGARRHYTVLRLNAYGSRTLGAGFGIAGRLAVQ